jgi:hypothetical protein
MTVGWAILTVVADFNKTHATNPAWTPHARFHVVWQISSYIGFGLLALALIWWPGPLAVERLYLVALMGAIVYAAFFAALMAMPLYGGAAYDKNGYQPVRGASPDHRKKMGRQHHGLLDSARNPRGRAVGGQWSACRLTEEPGAGGSPRTRTRFFKLFDEHFVATLADHRQHRQHQQEQRDREQPG